MSAQLPALQIEHIPEEFFIDLAVGVHSFEEICDNYEIPPAMVPTLETNAIFLRRLRIAQQTVDDDGTAFRARCRTAVADSVHHVLHMIKDSDVAPSTQLDAFKTLARYGGLEPAKAEGQQNVGPGLTLNIVAPDGASFAFGNTSQVVDNSVVSTQKAGPSLTIEEPKANKNVSHMFGAE